MLKRFPVCYGLLAAGDFLCGIRAARILEKHADFIEGIEDHAGVEGNGGPVGLEVFLLGIGEAVEFVSDGVGQECGIRVGGISCICPLKEHDRGGGGAERAACGLAPAGALDECFRENRFLQSCVGFVALRYAVLDGFCGIVSGSIFEKLPLKGAHS